MGSLEVLCGSMFAGKSEELIRRAKRAMIAKQRVLVVKPSIDIRYSQQQIVSHDGTGIQAIPIDPDKPQDILILAEQRGVNVVAIDEVQFFSSEILDIIQTLIKRNNRVIAAGLDLDFAGRPFNNVPTLLALADEVVKLKAICVVCGKPAYHTQRLIDGKPASRTSPLILIGGTEAYEARCRDCYELPD